jgi:predicted Zn-dependent peptidase
VGVGSRDETAQHSGSSHFLEHLLFKGTPTRSAMDISVALDEVGGEFNAFTAREYTCYHARVLDEDLPLTVEVLGDLITSSVIEPHDVEAEREVILDEIAMHDDDPEDVVNNLFAATAYGDTALGRPIAGTEDTISSLTRTQIARYYRSKYRPENIVVAVAGNVDHASVVRLVRTAFAGNGFLADRAARPLPARRGPRFRKAAAGTALVLRPFEQVNLVLGFNALSRTDERRYTLGILNAAIGGGPSSRLFQEVREERGLAYSVYSFAAHYVDAGTWGVAVGCLPSKQQEVLDVVRTELRRVADEGITEEELRRGKGQLRRGLVLSLEDTGSRMSRIAKAELLYDELPSVAEVVRRIESVALDDVHLLAKQVLTQPETLAVVGPT